MPTLKNMRIMHEDGSNALDWPDWVNSRALVANTAEAIPVPSGAAYVIFSAKENFFARYSTTAATVPGDVTDGSACELNPTVRYIHGVPSISVISTGANVVTAAFYRV